LCSLHRKYIKVNKASLGLRWWQHSRFSHCPLYRNLCTKSNQHFKTKSRNEDCSAINNWIVYNELQEYSRIYYSVKRKGKTTPLHAPEVFRKLRFPNFVTTAQDGGKVVSLTYRPPLLLGNTPGTHFC